MPGVPPALLPCLTFQPPSPPSPNSQLRVPAVQAPVPINSVPLPPYQPLAPLLPVIACGQPGHEDEQLDAELGLPGPPPPPEI